MAKYSFPRVITSAVAPTPQDDTTLGYIIGQPWVTTGSTKVYYVCKDNSAGAAIWTQVLDSDMYNSLLQRIIIIETVLSGVSADFSATNASGTVPLTVQFHDLSVGGATSWLWNFGDGNTSTIENPSHIYTQLGNYNVSLTVSDGTDTNMMSKPNFIIANQNLNADFTADNSYGMPPFTAHFISLPSGGSGAYSYLWNFGDGGASNINNPTHVYSQLGSYNVSLTVNDGLTTATKNKTGFITVTNSSDPYIIPTNLKFGQILVSSYSNNIYTAPTGWAITHALDDTALQIKHNLAVDPIQWSGVNLTGTTDVFLVPSSQRGLVNIDTNTCYISQTYNENMLINLLFDSVPSLNAMTIYRVHVGSLSSGTIAGPLPWTIVKNGYNLDITHNKTAQPIYWTSSDFIPSPMQNVQYSAPGVLSLTRVNLIGKDSFTVDFYFAS